MRAVATASDDEQQLVLEYRIVRADGEVRWVLDRGQLVPAREAGCGWTACCSTSPSAVRPRRRCAGARSRRRARPSSRVARPDRRRRRRGTAQDRARPARRRAAAARGARARRQGGPRAARQRPDAAGPFLDRLSDELSAASAELRELARGIHPAVLTQRGLGAAIEALAGRAPVPVEIVDAPAGRLSPTLETTAYFTVAEALTNVAKYAACLARDGAGGGRGRDARDRGARRRHRRRARPARAPASTGLADRVGACDGTLQRGEPAGRGHARARGAAAQRLGVGS